MVPMLKGILLTLALILVAVGIYVGSQTTNTVQTEYQHSVTVSSYPSPAEIVVAGVVKYKTPARVVVTKDEVWTLRYRDLDPIEIQVGPESPPTVYVEFDLGEEEVFIQKRATEIEAEKNPVRKKRTIKIEKVN